MQFVLDLLEHNGIGQLNGISMAKISSTKINLDSGGHISILFWMNKVFKILYYNKYKQLHRYDGPAVEYDVRKEWYINGVRSNAKV
jgi:hypothetical protein